MNCQMTESEKDIIDYVVVCISEFGSRFGLQMKDAYIYLRDFKGIDFLLEFYEAEHTLSFDDAIDDLTTICLKNGGHLS